MDGAARRGWLGGREEQENCARGPLTDLLRDFLQVKAPSPRARALAEKGPACSHDPSPTFFLAGVARNRSWTWRRRVCGQSCWTVVVWRLLSLTGECVARKRSFAINTGAMAHSCNPSSWDTEAKRGESQDGIDELKTCIGYVATSKKRKKKS